MRKNLGNRLLAVGWVVFLGFAACTVQVKDDDAGTGVSPTGSGGSGTAGTSSGSAGTSSLAGAAGQSGGSAGSGGSTTAFADASLPSYRDASHDAANGCIDDSTDGGDMSNPDLCSMLSGVDGSQCYDASAGKQLCDLMRANARPGAFQVFYNCIDAQTKNKPCDNDTEVSVCLDPAHWPTGCQVGKVIVSTGKSWDCTNLVAKCPVTDGGPDGFTLPECDFIMNVFNDEARTKIFDCYLSKPGATDPTTCKDDFTDCVYNPDQL